MHVPRMEAVKLSSHAGFAPLFVSGDEVRKRNHSALDSRRIITTRVGHRRCAAAAGTALSWAFPGAARKGRHGPSGRRRSLGAPRYFAPARRRRVQAAARGRSRARRARNRNCGVWPQSRRRSRCRPSGRDAARLLEAAKAAGAVPLRLEDSEYPALLREIGDPPPVLWVRGMRGALTRPAVAIVGSRAASAYALEVAARLGSEFGGAWLGGRFGPRTRRGRRGPSGLSRCRRGHGRRARIRSRCLLSGRAS